MRLSCHPHLNVRDAASGLCLATFHADGLLDGCVSHPDGEHLVVAGAQGIFS